MTVIRKNSIVSSSVDDPLEFILSDGSVDAYDDEVCPDGWDLADFMRNPIALVGHNPDFPVGKWTRVRVEGGKLRGHLTLAPAGTSPRIDEIRKLIEARILKAVSVGFTPLESIARVGSKRGGRKYLKQRLVECSIVSTPANSQALMMEARALGTSAATIRSLFKQSVDASLSERQAYARESLARARAIIAKVDTRVAREHAEKQRAEAEKMRKLGTPPSPAKLRQQELLARARAMIAKVDARMARDRVEKQRVDAEKQRAEAERQRMLRECAVPPGLNWPGYDYEPLLTFNGQPIYRRKNKYGW